MSISRDTGATPRNSFWRSDKAALLLCFLVAFTFWFGTKLSYDYKTNIQIGVNYLLPENQVLSNEQPDEIEVTLQADGWSVLRLAFATERPEVSIELGENEIRSIATSTFKSELPDLPNRVEILGFYPENLGIRTEKSVTKRVPIILDADIQLADNVQLSDSIKLEPSWVTLSGPASVIKDIDAWRTSTIVLQQVKKSNVLTVDLFDHENKSINYFPESVECYLNVEEKTEKQFMLPIEIMNAPDSVLLVILPNEATILYTTGLSKYDSYSADDFKLAVDFDGMNIFQYNQIDVKLVKKPRNIAKNLVTIRPSKVEYIIRNNYE